MKMLTSSSILFAVSNLLLLAGNAVAEESCACSVRYIVVEMPSQVPTMTAAQIESTKPSETVQIPSASETVTTTIRPKTATAQHNTTVIFTPVPRPDEDNSNPENCVPKKKVKLSYGAPKGTVPGGNVPSNKTVDGSINMKIDMNKPAVALDTIGSITKVRCSGDSITVEFGKGDGFKKAKESWAKYADFTIITSGSSGCDEGSQRSFFSVGNVSPDEEKQTITCSATKADISELADTLEMEFSSIPSTTLKKRLTLDPSVSLNFGAGLPEDTILFQEAPWVTVKADQAEFASTVTFSGYLKYNFWGFKLEDLYFDIDTQFSADVALSAEVAAAWSRSILYDPDSLTFSLIDVPGIISLGPGVGFAVGVDIDASGAVAVTAGAGISIPDGNVHLDVLDSAKNSATGWVPQYTSYANVSESVEVGLNASTSVTVQLTVKVLGGLIDLSSGLTATPALINKFTLDSEQSASASTNGTATHVGGASGGVVGDCDVTFKSDFVFDLVGFATKWWSANLYHTEVPITDICYDFDAPKTTQATVAGTVV
ncbi:hypothetical protein CDV31_005434 [Fusarium ambrosium]|uniref:DUF7029 domain-containing protein n=1 Tax=Fusarium ambrosium TaxID=131363 RepID=A0A428UJE3_9HYPO|nr:hypothetical protein CDV31_005434 [Fusarium ambrosium]